MSVKQSPRFEQTNRDPVFKREAVDVSAADYTPKDAGLFYGLNASVAGIIYIKGTDDVVVPEYVNTGWNPCGGKQVMYNVSNTATIKAAKLQP